MFDSGKYAQSEANPAAVLPGGNLIETALGKLSCGYDPATGVIHVSGYGLWDVAMLEAHFAALDRIVTRVRARHGEVLVFVDLRDQFIQSAEVEAMIAQESRRFFEGADRVAVIMKSSLLKVQKKNIARSPRAEFFLSPHAAMTWLTAYRSEAALAS